MAVVQLRTHGVGCSKCKRERYIADAQKNPIEHSYSLGSDTDWKGAMVPLF